MSRMAFLLVVCAVAATGGCTVQRVSVPRQAAVRGECPGDHPIKVTKENIAYGPWLRGRYGSIVAVRCYDSIASAVNAGVQVLEQNK